MRGFKIFIYIGLFFFGIYALSMLLVDESKNFVVEKEINYPIDKVFPQFNNLQNFTQWNEFFVNKKGYKLSYYTPYEGQGSSMNYQNMKTKSDYGDIFIRYAHRFTSLKYQLYEGNNTSPYKIDLKFIPNKNSTKIIWYISTPKTSYLGRSLNLISEDYIASTIDKSMRNLSQLLSGKVDKENLLSNIKYDTLMVENQKGMLLLGVNVSSVNKKGDLIKNIELNHGKVFNFVTKDLGKKEDEFGAPVLITDPRGFKNKEVSYYYGLPLSKRVGVSDNNFSFRTISPSDVFVIYYKGKYEGRVKAINQLLDKAKKDSMRNGELQETFIEAPNSRTDVKIKLSLPVFR